MKIKLRIGYTESETKIWKILKDSNNEYEKKEVSTEFFKT